MNKWVRGFTLLLCAPVLGFSVTLKVHGYAHVLVIDNAEQKDIVVSQSNRVSVKTNAEVIDVYASSDAQLDGRVTLNVHDLAIDRVELRDHGFITGENVVFDHLDLVIDTDKRVTLTGVVGVSKITQNKPAKTYLSFIDSPKVELELHAGEMSLRGIVDQFYVHMDGHSQLDASHLHSANIWLRSYDDSHAKLLPSYKFYANIFNHSKVESFSKAPIRSVNIFEHGAMMYQLNKRVADQEDLSPYII